MRGHRGTIAFLISVAPLAAGAATLPLDGKYGTELGCHVARTGEYMELDDNYLLTSESIATSLTYCSFNSVEVAPGGGHHVGMNCAQEGSGPEADIQEKADISGDPKAGYTLRFSDGRSWGPLTKCQ